MLTRAVLNLLTHLKLPPTSFWLKKTGAAFLNPSLKMTIKNWPTDRSQSKQKTTLQWHQNYCSDPTCGGRNYILKWVFFFFVQWILADRYIRRREMWVVSLKSWSSVEFKSKKIFLNFVFFRGVIEDWSFVWTMGSLAWLFTFSTIFFKLRSFLRKH